MKSARDRILEEIKSTKTDTDPLLTYTVVGIEYSNKKEQFIQMVKSIGGNAIEVTNESEIENFIAERITTGKRVLNISENEKLNYSISNLYATDVAIIRGGIAVAENAAIWLAEKNMGNRVLPFACEELVVVINGKNIVHNMHQAYDMIDISTDGFGVFIAGPSKTADIEQSLVIGAHGPINFLVLIINDLHVNNQYEYEKPMDQGL
jgi:L-lactate dehydrogenase complex protein LldG